MALESAGTITEAHADTTVDPRLIEQMRPDCEFVEIDPAGNIVNHCHDTARWIVTLRCGCKATTQTVLACDRHFAEVRSGRVTSYCGPWRVQKAEAL